MNMPEATRRRSTLSIIEKLRQQGAPVGGLMGPFDADYNVKTGQTEPMSDESADSGVGDSGKDEGDQDESLASVGLARKISRAYKKGKKLQSAPPGAGGM